MGRIEEFLRELCGDCNGCSTRPRSINQLCSNPLEKYIYRKQSIEPKPDGAVYSKSVIKRLAVQAPIPFEAGRKSVQAECQARIEALIEEQEAHTVAVIGMVVSHLWQFATGTGHPQMWKISDVDKQSVLKHYGVHYQGDNCPTCEGKCLKAKYISKGDEG